VRDIKPNNEQIYCSTTEIFVSITTSQPKTDTCIVKIELLTSHVSEWHVSAIAPCANCINICHRSGFFCQVNKSGWLFCCRYFCNSASFSSSFFQVGKNCSIFVVLQSWCSEDVRPRSNVQISEPSNYLYIVKPKFHLARRVTSRHDSTRSTCRVVSRRDATNQVEFGLK